MPEMTSRDEIVLKEILGAAKELFKQHGLKKTTMEDIAMATGKGKSTLYYYFTGKNEIFEAVVDEEMKNLIRHTRQAINQVPTASEKLKAYLRTRLSAMNQYHNLSQVVYEDFLDHIGTVLKIKQRHDQTQINMVKEIITGGVQSGELKELSENDIELFAYMLVAAFRGLELPLAVLPTSPDCEHRFCEMVDVMIGGMGK